jgi:hypothetical protein
LTRQRIGGDGWREGKGLTGGPHLSASERKRKREGDAGPAGQLDGPRGLTGLKARERGEERERKAGWPLDFAG